MFDKSQTFFNNWKIEEELGSGAFGTVYKIKREDFGKTFYSAMKVIQIPRNKQELISTTNELGTTQSVSEYYADFVKDFSKEIELMAQLKGHSNIVSYEDHQIIQNEDGIGWTILIRMELLQPFTAYQYNKELTIKEICKLGHDLCDAISLCESKKIIHRDIKPDNIFVTDDGTFKLGDFGIARELEKTTGGLSQKGTPSFMAPEVFMGKSYNHTVDIYSIGIVLYRLLNHNRIPFMPPFPEPVRYQDRENAKAKLFSGEKIPPIDGIPEELNRIVLKACSYYASNRYQSAEELKNDLVSFSKNIDENKATAPHVPSDDSKNETIGVFGDTIPEPTPVTPPKPPQPPKPEKDPTKRITPREPVKTAKEKTPVNPEVTTEEKKPAKPKKSAKKIIIALVLIILITIAATIIGLFIIGSSGDNYNDGYDYNDTTSESPVVSETEFKLYSPVEEQFYTISLPIKFKDLQNKLGFTNEDFDDDDFTNDGIWVAINFKGFTLWAKLEADSQISSVSDSTVIGIESNSLRITNINDNSSFFIYLDYDNLSDYIDNNIVIDESYNDYLVAPDNIENIPVTILGESTNIVVKNKNSDEQPVENCTIISVQPENDDGSLEFKTMDIEDIYPRKELNNAFAKLQKNGYSEYYSDEDLATYASDEENCYIEMCSFTLNGKSYVYNIYIYVQ